jgi:hypothetical protein
VTADRIIRTDLEMQAVARDGTIHLLFNETDAAGVTKATLTSNMLLPAAEALRFSMLLADLAFEADTGLKAAGPALKAELIERQRAKLVDRLVVVFNSQREKRTISNRSLARSVLDIVFSEVYS